MQVCLTPKAGPSPHCVCCLHSRSAIHTQHPGNAHQTELVWDSLSGNVTSLADVWHTYGLTHPLGLLYTPQTSQMLPQLMATKLLNTKLLSISANHTLGSKPTFLLHLPPLTPGLPSPHPHSQSVTEA